MEIEKNNEHPKKPPIEEITTEKVSLIVLAGDLAGFSSEYAMGSAIVVEEFIRRFYLICRWLIWHAGGELVKFTGDGFFAVWAISPSDIRATSDLCKRVSSCASTLSMFLKISGLDLKMDKRIHLKLGVVIEPNAIKISYLNRGVPTNDYLGKKINFAFRILALPQASPYVAGHSEFVEIQNKYPGKGFQSDYKKRGVTEDEVLKVFKGVRDNTDEVYVWQYAEDDKIVDLLVDDLHKRQMKPAEVARAKSLYPEIKDKLQMDQGTFDAMFNLQPKDFEGAPDWLVRSALLTTEWLKRMLSLFFSLKQLAAKQEAERKKLLWSIRRG